MYQFKLFVLDKSIRQGERAEEVRMMEEKAVNAWLAEHPNIRLEGMQTVVVSHHIPVVTLLYTLPLPN